MKHPEKTITIKATFKNKDLTLTTRIFAVHGLLTETKLNQQLRTFGNKEGLEFVSFKFIN